MGKRRRERDRPKSDPASLYNPNKRVLLCYDSDEEVDQAGLTAPVGNVPGPLTLALDDYQIQDYSDDANEDVVPNGDITPAAAPTTEATDATEWEEDDVGRRDQKGSLWARGCRRNLDTGQFPALGSIDFQTDGEEASSDDHEAMAYLRAVRSEREAMPSIFRAAISTKSDNLDFDLHDDRGYVEDGAYVARPLIGPSRPEGSEATLDAQEAFTRSLKKRFFEQRRQLHAPASGKGQASRDESHPTVFPRNDESAYESWRSHLSSTAPIPAQVRRLKQNTVLRLIEMARVHYVEPNQGIGAVTSAWLWALLARLEDVGTMDNYAVSIVRELGKAAAVSQASLCHSGPAEDRDLAIKVGSGDKQLQPVDELGGPAQSKNDDDTSKKQAIPQNTLATLDMVLVVVGDVYRQRDLLESRLVWPDAESPRNAENLTS